MGGDIMEKPSVSFKTRLLLIFFFLTLLPLLLVGVISYRYYYQAAREHTRFAASQTMMNLTREIDTVFTEAEQFLAIGSYTVTENYLSERGDPYANAKSILSLMELYRGKTPGRHDIIDVYLVGINGVGISEREGVFRLRTRFGVIPSLRRLEYGSEEQVILQFNRSDVSGYWDKSVWQRAALDDYRLSTGLARYLRDPIRKVVLGVAIVEVNAEKLENVCREQSRQGDVLYSIYDAEGRKLFGDSGEISPRDWPAIWERSNTGEPGSFVHVASGQEYFYIHNVSPRTGLRILGQASLDAMMMGAYRIRNITIASVVGCIIFTMLLYAFISEGLTKPLKTLQDKMRSASQGDLDVRFHSARRDEIAELGDGFNTMIVRIRDLMTEMRREHENSKRAEFRALQAQINPHFLYNTLDAILWMAQASRREELTEMVVALSKFFRLTLNGGRDIVTVREEVEHARNYLIIQRMRYRDILDFEFDVEPGIGGMRMIKLTLQPLIENAIYHGLKNKRGGGTIWVTGRYDRVHGTVAFRVRDNGKGMSPGRLTEVRANMNGRGGDVAEAEGGGYALGNVHERIQLSYGPEFGLSLESRLDEETVVTMVFPAVEQEYVEGLSG